MKRSQLFTKTTKTTPNDEVSNSAKLLIRAGYVYKEMAGVYDFLPLGKRVLDNIMQIIREELNAIGSQELQMTALQNKEVWEATDRWSDDVMDVWFKTKLNAGGEVGLAPTHEEPITRLMKSYISSYKDLPVYAYQFQTKFRNELRAKSGIMRTREFMMKDLYSFSKDRAEHDEFYEKCADTYKKIFNRLGIGNDTFRTFASGGAFSKFSDEFQTLCDAGEDIIYLDREKKIAVNDVAHDRLEVTGAEHGRKLFVEGQYLEFVDRILEDRTGAGKGRRRLVVGQERYECAWVMHTQRGNRHQRLFTEKILRGTSQNKKVLCHGSNIPLL